MRAIAHGLDRADRERFRPIGRYCLRLRHWDQLRIFLPILVGTENLSICGGSSAGCHKVARNVDSDFRSLPFYASCFRSENNNPQLSPRKTRNLASPGRSRSSPVHPAILGVTQ